MKSKDKSGLVFIVLFRFIALTNTKLNNDNSNNNNNSTNNNNNNSTNKNSNNNNNNNSNSSNNNSPKDRGSLERFLDTTIVGRSNIDILPIYFIEQLK